jgi:hypothetical protein
MERMVGTVHVLDVSVWRYPHRGRSFVSALHAFPDNESRYSLRLGSDLFVFAASTSQDEHGLSGHSGDKVNNSARFFNPVSDMHCYRASMWPWKAFDWGVFWAILAAALVFFVAGLLLHLLRALV